tara:strand:+ start:140 stop:385 length:246 start_codon:yes stop_codon:yes gene_type:complete
MSKKMNNIIQINPIDPIINEYEGFVDKSAGIKTIAFKYFGADVQKAIDYLAIEDNNFDTASEIPNLHLVEEQEYYQPELLH